MLRKIWQNLDVFTNKNVIFKSCDKSCHLCSFIIEFIKSNKMIDKPRILSFFPNSLINSLKHHLALPRVAIV